MKRTHIQKLALNRETLVSLTASDLAGVNGGDVGPGGPRTRTSLVGGCPSRLQTVCPTDGGGDSLPPRSRALCPQQGQ